MSIFIELRGIEVEVEYRDYGYEPDTNAHDIDWWIIDPPGFENLTNEEEQMILDALHKHVAEPDCDYDE